MAPLCSFANVYHKSPKRFIAIKKINVTEHMRRSLQTFQRLHHHLKSVQFILRNKNLYFALKL